MATIEFDRSKPIVPDVNQWHFVLDWAAYARALDPTNLCLAKVGNGDTGGTDARYEVHRDNAGRRGLLFGGYWYSPRQIDLFLKRFPPQPNAFPIIDFEGDATVKDAVAAAGKLQSEWGFFPTCSTAAASGSTSANQPGRPSSSASTGAPNTARSCGCPRVWGSR